MTKEQKSWKNRLSGLGISQADFARSLDIYLGQMCDYMNCKIEPTATTFMKIENKLRELESVK